MAITLKKGQGISLAKVDGNSGLTHVVMGLGWDVAKRGFLGFGRREDIDLDASCFIFDDQNNVFDLVYFAHLRSNDGSVQHSGDNRTGAGEGDDEQIAVNLQNIPANIKTLVFTVNNYSGQSFERVKNAYCRLVNGKNGEEIARYNLSAQGKHNAQIMAKLYREQGEWRLQAIGENSEGILAEDLLPQILRLL